MKRWRNGPLVSRFQAGAGSNWIFHMLLILLWLTLLDNEQMGVYSVHPFLWPLPPHAHSCTHSAAASSVYGHDYSDTRNGDGVPGLRGFMALCWWIRNTVGRRFLNVLFEMKCFVIPQVYSILFKCLKSIKIWKDVSGDKGPKVPGFNSSGFIWSVAGPRSYMGLFLQCCVLL